MSSLNCIDRELLPYCRADVINSKLQRLQDVQVSPQVSPHPVNRLLITYSH
jgi:hypothetical protein